jgi:hypothetical protein
MSRPTTTGSACSIRPSNTDSFALLSKSAIKTQTGSGPEGGIARRAGGHPVRQFGGGVAQAGQNLRAGRAAWAESGAGGYRPSAGVARHVFATLLDEDV